MAAPQNFPRDIKGLRAQMLMADVSNEVFTFLEALAAGEVEITPKGRATGKVLATLKKWVLHIDLKTQQWTYPLTGTETLPNFGTGYLTIEIEDTGLPDGTPVAVDTYNLDYPIQFCGARVQDGGTIRIYYQMAVDEPPINMPVGVITVRPIL